MHSEGRRGPRWCVQAQQSASVHMLGANGFQGIVKREVVVMVEHNPVEICGHGEVQNSHG